jgi:hypothetical protein
MKSRRQSFIVSATKVVVGQLQLLPAVVVLTADLLGEHRGNQVFGPGARDGWRHPLAMLHPRERQRATSGPPKAGTEDGRLQHRLGQHPLSRRRRDEVEDVEQGKAVLLAQRKQNAVVARGSLQLEVEGSAKRLAQGHTPGAIDAGPERRVQNQLHAPRLVEEAFGDHAGRSGHGAQGGAPGAYVAHQQLGHLRGQAQLLGEPRNYVFASGDVFAQPRDLG